MSINPLAVTLNEVLVKQAPAIASMLSDLGRELFYPKGILTQTAEAKQKASRFNATIGIALEDGRPMALPPVLKQISGLSADEALNYAPSFGQPALRTAWRDQILAKNPSLDGKALSLPLVTSGITHGLSLAADLFVERGDTLLLPDQLWGNYRMIFATRRGAVIKEYPFYNQDGGFNVGGLADLLEAGPNDAKFVLILNFPNNPTGYSPSANEQRQLVDVLTAAAERGQRLVVLCDDAYFGLDHDGTVAPESVFGPLADAHENLLAVKLDGATKEDYVWGFRVGFITFAAKDISQTACEALEKKVAGCLRGTISNCSALAQSILIHAMADPEYQEWKKRKNDILSARARKVREILKDSRFQDVWEPYPFNSGYFMCLRLKHTDAESLRLRLLERDGVGVIATAEKDLRVAISCVEENQLSELFEILYNAARDIVSDR